MPENNRQNASTPGRDYPGIVGEIISVHLGEIIGIRMLDNAALKDLVL